MNDSLAYLAGALSLIGAIFGLLAAIGIVRMPDLYTRMHAATKAGTIGGGAVFLAVGAGCADGAVLVRSLIGIVFLALTTPVSAHLLARAAHLSGHRSESINEVDELQNNTKS